MASMMTRSRRPISPGTGVARPVRTHCEKSSIWRACWFTGGSKPHGPLAGCAREAVIIEARLHLEPAARRLRPEIVPPVIVAGITLAARAIGKLERPIDAFLDIHEELRALLRPFLRRHGDGRRPRAHASLLDYIDAEVHQW